MRLDCISGNISFYRKVSSEELSDYLTFYIDGVEKDTWSGDEDWAKVSFNVEAGTRTFEWTYSKDLSDAEGDDTAWIDDIVFPIDPGPEPPPPPPPPDQCAVEDFETNDFSKFPWEHEGDSHWTTTSWEKHSGNYSAQVGRINGNESTTLRVTLDCRSGNITFYRKVSSDAYWDYLIFYINGEEKGRWSGEEDWAKRSFPITAGRRTFEWTYSKDSSVDDGDDTAWIDDIVLPPPSPAPPPPPPPPPPTSNLVGWWKFDEKSGYTAYDSSGNANHGTLHSDPRRVAGHDGSALSFDGVDDCVEIPDDDSLTPSSEITISFWINNRGGNSSGIFKFASCNLRAYSFQIADESDIVCARVYSDTMTYGDIYSNGSVSKNRWHHLALTFNRGNAAIYINGQLDKSALMSVSSITNDDQPLTIGGYWSYCDEKFLEKALNGIVDELMIFDRALSVEEIQKLFREH
ncbi:MAG: LamG domain-containing protein [Desulfobacterales bacterium]|nr:LamG domain-containing protein [Desulfobacterales bacterium]